MTLEERLEKLEASHRVLQAKEDIRHLITRYARAIDENVETDIVDIFTEDASSQSLPWGAGRMQDGRDRVVRSFTNYIATFEKPRRFIVNEQIEVTGERTATGWANWFVVQSFKGDSYYGWGFYEWDFKLCDDDIWRFSKFIINLESMTTLDRGWGDLSKRVMDYPT